MTSRGKMSRRAADDFDDADDGPPGYQSKAPSRGGHSTRESVRRNHTDDEDDEEPRASTRGAAKSSRGGRRRYESEEDEPPSRGGKAGTSRALVVRNKSNRGEEDYDDDEPPSRGGRAGGSRALVTRKGNRGDDERETVTVSRYEPMMPNEIHPHEFHGLIKIFQVTPFQIESWCGREKIVWDNTTKEPSFHKLLDMYPDKRAAWEDWQESKEFAIRRAQEIDMDRQAYMAEVEDAIHRRQVAREIRIRARYGW